MTKVEEFPVHLRGPICGGIIPAAEAAATHF